MALLDGLYVQEDGGEMVLRGVEELDRHPPHTSLAVMGYMAENRVYLQTSFSQSQKKKTFREEVKRGRGFFLMTDHEFKRPWRGVCKL